MIVRPTITITGPRTSQPASEKTRKASVLSPMAALSTVLNRSAVSWRVSIISLSSSLTPGLIIGQSVASPEFDIVVVGAGLVGLATGRELLRRYPDRRLAILEKEAVIASHHSGRNSGVIHS